MLFSRRRIVELIFYRYARTRMKNKFPKNETYLYYSTNSIGLAIVQYYIVMVLVFL